MTVIIFDLDGTLINTGLIAIKAYRQAMLTSGLPSGDLPSDEAILKTFGLPDVDIWSSLMPNWSHEEQTRAFHLAGEILREDMPLVDISLPYARETVDALHRRGYTLTTASNCGLDYLDTVMTEQGFGQWMDRPLCLESVNGREKADILREHIRRYGDEELVLVGDRSTDRDAAQAVGIPFVGCHYGFGDADELIGAKTIVTNLPQLLDVFP